MPSCLAICDGSHALSLELLDLDRINRCRRTFADARSLGLRDALHLPLFAQALYLLTVSKRPNAEAG
jgi:hypothetical protein